VSVRFGVLLALAFGAAVAYLASLNTAPVHVTGDWAREIAYRCAACGAEHGRWTDRCPSCLSWNTSRP
jgi:lipopolysaccharide biosynthesis regulator YciM